MDNYRATFLHSLEVNYWNKGSNLQPESSLKFRELPDKYYKIILEIKSAAYLLGIKNIWHFYEPYIEITWLNSSKEESELLFNKIDKILEKNGITDCKRQYPKDGNFADWFCHNEDEREFGALVHAKCGQIVDLFHFYQDSISRGKTKREQVKRTIHRLCNPLGLNYLDEAYVCFSRGLICLLFRFFSFKKAVWIYKNIFRQKY